MRYKLINNELYIAKKIILSNYEKKVLDIFMTLGSISLKDLSCALRLNALFTQQIINNLNDKICFVMRIDKIKMDNKTFYKLKEL